MGKASEAARRLKSDRPTTIPARKAPSAMETPNSSAEPTAMPSATTSTVSVKSSRERVSATRSSSQGMRRPPTSMVKATRASSFSAASPRASGRWLSPAC